MPESIQQSMSAEHAEPCEIIIYELTTTSTNKTLPKLIEKVYNQGHKILIKLNDEEQLNLVDQYLWTFSSLAFLPHGSVLTTALEDGHLQSIWLTNNDFNANDAKVLVLTTLPPNMPTETEQNAQNAPIEIAFEKIIYVLDTAEFSSANILDFYRALQVNNRRCTLWQQQLDNTWQKLN